MVIFWIMAIPALLIWAAAGWIWYYNLPNNNRIQNPWLRVIIGGPGVWAATLIGLIILTIMGSK